ncbi:MAG: tetratricopeptide repeat protein [Desulfarculus sp.]|nr:tetratricopeptide repeat protein [Desulfarculus sp.]
MEPWGVVVKAALPWVKKQVQAWKLDHDIEAVFHQAFTDAPESVAVLCEKRPQFIGQIMALAQGKTPDLDLMLEGAAACHAQYQYAEFARPQVVRDLRAFSRDLNNQWRAKAGPKFGDLPQGYGFFFIELSSRQDGLHPGQAATHQEPPRPAGLTFYLPRRYNGLLRHYQHWQDEIQRHLAAGGQAALEQSPSGRDLALGGQGGIGKTAMAVQYAYTHAALYPGGVYWLQADLGLAQALAQVALGLGWPLPEQANDQIITGLVLRCIQENPGRKLVILDNLEDPGLVNALACLPQACLLATTRKSDVNLPPIPMDLPPEEEALGIFLAYAAKEGQALDEPQRRAAYDICQRVGFLPLALEIMGKLARTQALTDLAHDLTNRIEVVEKEGLTHTKDLTSVAAALGLADGRYSHSRAREALVYLGYLHPENLDAGLLGLVMLAEIGKENNQERIVGEAKEMLASLADCSVLRVREEGGYTMHRLVQEAARLMDPEREVGARVVTVLDAVIWGVSKTGAYRQAYPFIPHLTHLGGQDSGSADLKAFPSAYALARWGEYLMYSGHYSASETFMRAVLARVDRAKGKEHPEYATTLNNLAGVLEDQGKLEEAEELYRQAMAIGEKTIGKEHPNYATLLNNLAGVLEDQGKLEEAEELYRQALDIDEKTIGKEHPIYAIRLNNLARVLWKQGKLEETEGLFRQAMAIHEKTTGKEHADYATNLNNLALVLEDQGKLEEAEKLYRQALDIGEKTIGKEHPDYAIRLNNLAGVLRAQGKLEEAEELYRQALAISLKALGPEHPHTKIFQRNLALLLAAMKKKK